MTDRESPFEVVRLALEKANRYRSDGNDHGYLVAISALGLVTIPLRGVVSRTVR